MCKPSRRPTPRTPARLRGSELASDCRAVLDEPFGSPKTRERRGRDRANLLELIRGAGEIAPDQRSDCDSPWVRRQRGDRGLEPRLAHPCGGRHTTHRAPTGSRYAERVSTHASTSSTKTRRAWSSSPSSAWRRARKPSGSQELWKLRPSRPSCGSSVGVGDRLRDVALSDQHACPADARLRLDPERRLGIPGDQLVDHAARLLPLARELQTDRDLGREPAGRLLVADLLRDRESLAMQLRPRARAGPASTRIEARFPVARRYSGPPMRARYLEPCLDVVDSVRYRPASSAQLRGCSARVRACRPGRVLCELQRLPRKPGRALVLVREHREPAEVREHAQPSLRPSRIFAASSSAALEVRLRSRPVAAEPAVLAEHHLCPRRIVGIAGGERVACAERGTGRRSAGRRRSSPPRGRARGGATRGRPRASVSTHPRRSASRS